MGPIDWLDRIRAYFPELNKDNCRLTSPVDDHYNCIAWAAEDLGRWWWPDPLMQKYWPSDAPRTESVAAFVSVFKSLGYEETTDDSIEDGKQKVAIFVGNRGMPTHAARQLSDGWWTSKLGPQFDIEHELSAIQGPVYGVVAVVLERSVVPPLVN